MGGTAMEHLMDAIDRRLTELGLSPISGVVNNREQCTRHISRILEDHGNKVAIPFQDTLEQYDFRVKHVLFSFGLGIVLAPLCHLEDRIQAACRREAPPSFLYVWLTVCLYHDFGYFIAPACRSAASLDALDLAHPIFDAGYCESRYSRRLYEAYYREKYARHGPDSEEVGDHGILGGCVLFDRLWEAGDPHRRPLYQDICWRIMEHNIWKREQSLPPEDPFSEIDADRFRPIGLSEPLLYLLSLVDTLEMTKRFCTYLDSAADKTRYIYPKTLGSKVRVEVTDASITLDSSEMERFIRSNRYFDGIKAWKRGVTGLPDWVQTAVFQDGGVFTLTQP